VAVAVAVMVTAAVVLGDRAAAVTGRAVTEARTSAAAVVLARRQERQESSLMSPVTAGQVSSFSVTRRPTR